jgi:hypothetical protein
MPAAAKPIIKTNPNFRIQSSKMDSVKRHRAHSIYRVRKPVLKNGGKRKKLKIYMKFMEKDGLKTETNRTPNHSGGHMVEWV